MTTGNQPLKILFLCTGNSCRSQMAEGWARQLFPGIFEAYSAGTAPQALDPRAVKVMAEVGVDISKHRAKAFAELRDQDFDLAVTVCDQARENCPAYFGRAQKLHQSFDDPPYLAKNVKDEEAALAHYRKVRDQIRAFVQTLPDIIHSQENVP
ncbi:MAG: arsenate reductase ArsC [Elusimicrobiota bacterium]|jgi:arsenate reductase